MLLRQRSAARPFGFVEPSRPSRAARPPSGPLWIHEIKHDGFRLMVRREGARVRLFTRGGYDWADRFPAIVEAASTIRARSFLIDGEAMICRNDGVSDFDARPDRMAG
jgi:bifunctional non-homologous end joining protein LigD